MLFESYVKDGGDSFWMLCWIHLAKGKEKNVGGLSQSDTMLKEFTPKMQIYILLLLLSPWKWKKGMPNLQQWKGACMHNSPPHGKYFLFSRNNSWLFCNCWCCNCYSNMVWHVNIIDQKMEHIPLSPFCTNFYLSDSFNEFSSAGLEGWRVPQSINT